MSIEYYAAIVVGLPRGEISDESLIDNDEIQVFPPYYDGDGSSSSIAGLEYKSTSSYSSKEIEVNPLEINNLKEEFRRLTKQEGKLYLTPVGH